MKWMELNVILCKSKLILFSSWWKFYTFIPTAAAHSSTWWSSPVCPFNTILTFKSLIHISAEIVTLSIFNPAESSTGLSIISNLNLTTFPNCFPPISHDCAIQTKGFSLHWINRCKVKGREVCLLFTLHGAQMSWRAPAPQNWNILQWSVVPTTCLGNSLWFFWQRFTSFPRPMLSLHWGNYALVTVPTILKQNTLRPCSQQPGSSSSQL